MSANNNRLLFLDRYNELCDRMKKKLFRRPNFTEVTNELTQIGHNLDGFHHAAEFSHFVFKKRTVCEKQNLRSLYATQLECARTMFVKEIDEYQFGLDLTGDNYVIATKTFYDIVEIISETDFKILGVYLLCELADYSIHLEQYSDAIAHLHRSLRIKATDSSFKDYFYYSICYRMVQCAVVSKNYHKSHQLINELILDDVDWSSNNMSHCPADFIGQINVTNILLILLNYPRPVDITVAAATRGSSHCKLPFYDKFKMFMDHPIHSNHLISTHIPIEMIYCLRSFVNQFHIGNSVVLMAVKKQLFDCGLSDVNSLIVYELLRRYFDPELANNKL